MSTEETIYAIELSYTEIDNICWALYDLGCRFARAAHKGELDALFDKLKVSRCVENVVEHDQTKINS